MIPRLTALGRLVAGAYIARTRRLAEAYRAGALEAARVWQEQVTVESDEERDRRFQYVAWLLRLTIVLLLLGGVAALSLVAETYKGEAVWAPLVTGFAATALGVFLALTLQRELEQRRARETVRREELADEGRRLSEARLGFSAISEELEILDGSLLRIGTEHRTEKYLVIDLPTGSWEAARSRLGVIISDYELMARLSRFYGRVADLQYWLRLKSQAVLLNRDDEVPEIENKIDKAIEQATADAGSLTERIVDQIREPSVRFELTHRVSASLTMPYEVTAPSETADG